MKWTALRLTLRTMSVYVKCNMADQKPEVEITFVPIELGMRYKFSNNVMKGPFTTKHESTSFSHSLYSKFNKAGQNRK